jgi:hypothetical protein
VVSSLQFLQQMFCRYFSSSMCTAYRGYLILTLVGEECKLWRSTLCRFLRPHITSFLWGPNFLHRYYSQTFSNIRSKSLWCDTLIWTLSIILFLFKNTMFRRLDSISIFRWNILSWAQLTELVPISGHLYQHHIGYTSQAQHKPSARAETEH